MMKIRAYTLMEVTVAMLLSAICITICYAAYGIIGHYYAVFQQKNQQATEALALKHVLERDFLKCRFVLKSDEGFEVLGDSVIITYAYKANYIVRKWNTLHVDTFKLENSGLLCYFEDKVVAELDTVDQVQFKLALAKDRSVPVQINKLYSAENLVK